MKIVDTRTGEEVRFRSTESYRAEMQPLWAGCSHERVERRRFTVSNGAVQISLQCLDCGRRVGQSLKADGSDPPSADHNLSDVWEAARRAKVHAIEHKHIDLRKAENADFWVDYDRYLLTDQWQARRKFVIERAHGRCEGCMQADATQVHHLTYDHVFNELLFELVAICDACHERCHAERDVT